MTPPTVAAPRRAAYKERLRDWAHGLMDPLVRRLAGSGVRADHLTVLGLVLSLGAGVAFFDGHSRLAALLLVFAGLCDILDGEVARRAGVPSRFGAFLDSTLDRLAESFVLLGILGFYLRNLVALVLSPERVMLQLQMGLEPITWAVLAFLAALALTGSFMVSYTRARAEGLGLECKVGFFERPERIVLLIVAGLFKAFQAMSAALLLLAVLSFITAWQRLAHVWRITRGAGADGPGTPGSIL